jgi:hypothetical protein
MAQSALKKYYVQDLDFREEIVEATSVKTTAALISFFRDEALVFAIPVSHLRRIGETEYKTYEELEAEKEDAPQRQAFLNAVKFLHERNTAAPAGVASNGQTRAAN